ncbi:MAG: VCBS repeat-containing protein [Chitinophagaceae bacterium]|nr:VCBS repeat-containing protein [Chitinophagaceae bacterium]
MRNMNPRLAVLCIACQIFLYSNAQQPKLFSSLPGEQTGIHFNNELYEDDRINYYSWEYLYIGAGVAVGDINNDGLQDIYFSSTTGYCKLYLNMGNLQFRDITDPAGVNGGLGVKTGVTMVDFNYDGWMDIFVCKSGPFTPQYREKLLYINNQNGTFTESAKKYGLNDASFSTQSYFFDYDNDGDLDVFFLNHPNEFVTSMQVNATMVNNKMKLIDDTARTYVSHQLLKTAGGIIMKSAKKPASPLMHSVSVPLSMILIMMAGRIFM